MTGLAGRAVTVIEIEVSYERTIEQRRAAGGASSAADECARTIEREGGYIPKHSGDGILTDCANRASHRIEDANLER